ncbi:cytochrome P450 [Streptomyces sp. YU58]|uniref:cytochrome P450 n=1 Tax=Streptomyces sp. SX92 TaxID=3158972 RepID=UPI0027BAD952|nr:cytochrome P450 [Streptomyces coralus]WLW56335.1 cytochrome P450 [Streptomyces coralus]
MTSTQVHIPAAGAAPGAVPLFGHALTLLRDPLGFLRSLPAHGELVEIRLGLQRAYVVCTPELTHQVLTDDRTFDKGGPMVDRTRDALGNGLPTCPRTQHRRQRRLVQPAFTAARLAGYAPIMEREVRATTDRWQTGQPIDVLGDMQALTGRILVATMFARISDQRITEILDILRDIQDGFLLRIALPAKAQKLPVPALRRSQRARTRLRGLIGDIIDHRRATPDDRSHRDLLSTLLAPPDPATDGTSDLTKDEITDQCLNFFFAGTETTASLLAWSLHLLAQHPEVERQLHTETDQILNGGAASLKDLPHLELTDRIITETLRLYPAGWFITRTVTRDTELAGQPLAAGTPLVYSPYLIHHLPGHYPDPEQFDPDRWKDISGPPSRQRAFVAFGAGARKCIGDQYGIIEATLALASITARWQLRPVPGAHVRSKAGISLAPRGLRLIATLRRPHGLSA